MLRVSRTDAFSAVFQNLRINNKPFNMRVCISPSHTHTHRKLSEPHACKLCCPYGATLIGYCDLHSMRQYLMIWGVPLSDTVYTQNKNSLQSQYLPQQPVFASFAVPGGGHGLAGLLLKSSPLLPECGTAAFWNPTAPSHSSWRAKKKRVAIY